MPVRNGKTFRISQFCKRIRRDGMNAIWLIVGFRVAEQDLFSIECIIWYFELFQQQLNSFTANYNRATDRKLSSSCQMITQIRKQIQLFPFLWNIYHYEFLDERSATRSLRYLSPVI